MRAEWLLALSSFVRLALLDSRFFFQYTKDTKGKQFQDSKGKHDACSLLALTITRLILRLCDENVISEAFSFVFSAKFLCAFALGSD